VISTLIYIDPLCDKEKEEGERERERVREE
jgi:hypothetical protein